MIVNLTIKTIDRKVYSIDINNLLTINDLKNLLLNKYQFINKELVLILDGKVLNNDVIIKNINIPNEKYIILLLKNSKNSSLSNSINTDSFLESNISVDSNQRNTTINQTYSTDILENTQPNAIDYTSESIDNELSNTIELLTKSKKIQCRRGMSLILIYFAEPPSKLLRVEGILKFS